MTVRSIAAVKTARYVVLGPEDGPADEVWVACHGYGQLATYFARHFKAVVSSEGASSKRLIVVPEALSRFYLDGPGAGSRYTRIGATWMTKEERTTDIADVTRYLDDVLVAACARADVDPISVPLGVLGFSQGTATASRWLALSPLLARRTRLANRLVIWGSGLAHDIELANLAGIPLTLVAGDRDEIATPGRIVREDARLREAGLNHQLVRYDGGHRLHAATLETVMPSLA
ncbi:MAG: esterase [Rubricoccaceae bacterium]